MKKNVVNPIQSAAKSLLYLYHRLQRLWHHSLIIFHRIEDHHIFLLASGISYDTLLFALPTLLVMIFLVGLFTDAATLLQTLIDLLPMVFPPEQWSQSFVAETTEQLQWIFDRALQLGWITIPAVFWLGSTLFGSVRTALNAVFERQEPGFFLKYKLKDLGILLAFTLLLILVGLINTVFAALEIAITQSFPAFSPLWLWLRNGVSLLITIMFFYFLYRLPPHGSLPRMVILLSTAIATVLWEGAKFLFSWYMSTVASYGTIYGTYAVIVVAALWLYYTWLIFLVAAEIARYWYEYRLNTLQSRKEQQ